MNSGDRIYMAELLTQLKLAHTKKAEAEKDLDLWTDRMKLARERGAEDLYHAAHDRASRAEEALRRAEATIMEIEVQRDAFKREVREAVNPRVARSQQLVASLKGTDLDPDQARMERLSKESAADDALAALKRKMQGGD